MTYILNSLLFYSILGFILESTVYKITNSKRHSGICYGPVTYVYGFGILALILLKKYFLDKLNTNKILKLIITYLTSLIILTLIEWLGGNLLNIIFKIDMWNYLKKDYNFGKYICLELSLIWGLLGTIYIYYIKNFFDEFLKKIPKRLTYLLLGIQFIDCILVFINKLP